MNTVIFTGNSVNIPLKGCHDLVYKVYSFRRPDLDGTCTEI